MSLAAAGTACRRHGPPLFPGEPRPALRLCGADWLPRLSFTVWANGAARGARSARARSERGRVPVRGARRREVTRRDGRRPGGRHVARGAGGTGPRKRGSWRGWAVGHVGPGRESEASSWSCGCRDAFWGPRGAGKGCFAIGDKPFRKERWVMLTDAIPCERAL